MTEADIREAAAGLAGVAVRTAVREVPDTPGARTFLKCEFEQPVGAFKLRGAYTAVRRLPEAERRRGVITHSSGNHARALAWAARRFGVPALIVMPADAPKVKVAGVRAEGAEIVFVEDRRDRDPRCRELAAARDMVMIPPYEHADVIAGQGTVGLEIAEQCPEAGTVLVPVGGGGLLAGVAVALAATRPDVVVVGVEPAGAAKLSAALAAGRPAPVEAPASIADGLLPPQLGALPWSALAGIVSRAITVCDDDIRAAMRHLHRAAGLVVEPSGATALAAVLAGHVTSTRPVVAIASGGNVDPELFQRLVS